MNTLTITTPPAPPVAGEPKPTSRVALLLDGELIERLKAERQRTGGDRFDEVWNGVYVMTPLANNEHQNLGFELAVVLSTVAGPPPAARVFAGVNVSDRDAGWEHNYRCPDVAVYFAGNPARDCGTHWLGGPDFLVEILSPNDRGRDKLPFYASVGTREVLVIDRDPWALELYRLQGDQLAPAGRSSIDTPAGLASSALPLSFALAAGTERPAIEITHADGRRWVI